MMLLNIQTNNFPIMDAYLYDYCFLTKYFIRASLV